MSYLITLFGLSQCCDQMSISTLSWSTGGFSAKFGGGWWPAFGQIVPWQDFGLVTLVVFDSCAFLPELHAVVTSLFCYKHHSRQTCILKLYHICISKSWKNISAFKQGLKIVHSPNWPVENVQIHSIYQPSYWASDLENFFFLLYQITQFFKFLYENNTVVR